MPRRASAIAKPYQAPTPLSAIDPTQFLSPPQLVEAAAAMGLKLSTSDLAHKRCTGRGIRFRKHGARVLYQAGHALEDLTAQISPPRTSTSQRDFCEQDEP
jgi:hypothetical protein